MQKSRKMNFQMLMLIDCIGYPQDKIPADLLTLIKNLGDIIDIKSVAYKSLKNLQVTSDFDQRKLGNDLNVSNNLYVFWLAYYNKKSNNSYNLKDLLQDIDHVSNKIQFLQFVDSFCLNLFQQNKIDNNPYFDRKMFQDTIAVIE